MRIDMDGFPEYFTNEHKKAFTELKYYVNEAYPKASCLLILGEGASLVFMEVPEEHFTEELEAICDNYNSRPNRLFNLSYVFLKDNTQGERFLVRDFYN